MAGDAGNLRGKAEEDAGGNCIAGRPESPQLRQGVGILPSVGGGVHSSGRPGMSVITGSYP